MIDTYSVPEFYKAIRHTNPGGNNGALLSPDGKYRYLLWRRWEPGAGILKWLMLNPSTADGLTDDATIRKCVAFAKSWGYGTIEVVNLFAYRATDPKELKGLGYREAVGMDNNEYIFKVLDSPGQNIAAWGQNGKLWGRAADVRFRLAQRRIKLHALKLAKDGCTPYHPLYLKSDLQPFEI